MPIRSVILPVAITLAVGVAAAGLLASHDQAIREHSVTIPTAVRTVRISATMPAPSASARHLSAMLVEGMMPSQETMAEVMSDTRCTPDASMVSRCRNEMRLPDGTTIAVRHPHDMRDVPCLAPGEHVLLVPNA